MNEPEVPIARALAALKAGEAVVYPTETVYAIGVDALSPAALERLFAIKGREIGKAVALITDNAANAFSLAAEVPPAACKLAAAFWPGPLTLVLPARAGLPSPLIGAEGGVGVRVSPHRTAIELAARLGRPLTATSANLSGQPPAVTIEQARGAFAQHVAAYLDGGELGASAPSTVVAFDSTGKWHVIRAGAIAPGLLAAALGESAQ